MSDPLQRFIHQGEEHNYDQFVIYLDNNEQNQQENNLTEQTNQHSPTTLYSKQKCDIFDFKNFQNDPEQHQIPTNQYEQFDQNEEEYIIQDKSFFKSDK